MATRIDNEFPGVDLGDERRNRRLVRFAQRMAESPQRSVKSACRGAAESMGAYRLMHRQEVTPEQILGPHQRAAVERAAHLESGDVLLVQDTTELDFSTHKALKGSGPLGEKERRGFFAHNRLLVGEEEEVALGLCGSEIWARRDEEAGASKDRKRRPIEQKESHRWVKTYGVACKIADKLPEKQIVVVGDRESDIYELYEAWAKRLRGNPGSCVPALVVRIGRDRALSGELAGGHVYSHIRHKAPILGEYSIPLESKVQMKKVSGGSKIKTWREGRNALLEVRACSLILRAPYRKGRKLEDITLWAMVALEKKPPKGQDPIQWFLYSTTALDSWESAQRVLKIYQQRWLIEEYHRVLKTGCRVEQMALRQAGALLPALAIAMIIAWRILYLRDMARHCGDLPATCCFEPFEWKAVWIVALKMDPHDARAPPNLGEMLREVAILGGYHGRRNDPPPGAECIWRGMHDMRRYAEALQAVGEV